MSGGYIYVLKWSTGAIKVGRSHMPKERINQHENNARLLGVKLQDLYVLPCANSHHAERLLINWVAARAIAVEGNEWVFGLKFDAVCEFAKSLEHAVPVVTVGAAEHKDRLAQAMADAGLNSAQFAELLGVTRQAIEKLINGSSKSMAASNIFEAARLLNVDAEWLATGKNSKAPA